MKRTWMALALLVLSFTLSAADLDGYKKRFVIKRTQDGKLDSVKMKFTKGFSIAPYLAQIKNDIKAEIANMSNKSAYRAELDEFITYLEDGSAYTKENQENIGHVRHAIENLPNVDVDESFEGIQAHGVLEKFEFDLKDALKMMDLSIIANPNDSRFFYRKNVTYKAATMALDFAKKKFDSVPLLNLVSFVIVQVHDMVLEQRTFHQNMLLHYLQNFKPSELGITKEEADKIFSSIYESRIGLVNLLESNRAASNWLRFGTDKFFTTVRAANNKIRRSTHSYDSVNERYNYAFVEVVEDGEKVVKNLVDGKHMLSSAAPTAYYYSRPNKVKRTRALLNIGEVALGFLPIPGWIKSQVEGFVESFYVNHRVTEGALVAYFESNGNMTMARNIKNQMGNPYILFK